MGKGGKLFEGEKPSFSWEEIKTHDVKEKPWLVIEGEVYDITNWIKKHPGGNRVIGFYAGQDATDAFQAFHNDLNYVKKYLKPLNIGKLDESQTKGDKFELEQDFRKLRETAEKMDLFRPSYTFFILSLGHILLLEVLAYLNMLYFGTGWGPYLLSVLLYTIVQAQSGWLQHDFGHISVFKGKKWDHIIHHFLMGFTKGASSSWWKHMHYQHHAKPNVINKDPDVRVESIFVLGDVMPVEVAKTRKKSLPYNWQHRYFFLIVPPLLFPVYFQYMIFRYTITRRQWKDLVCLFAFFAKLFFLYGPLLGFWGALRYYFLVRCLESHWFTWVSQSNHIPMTIEKDQSKPWLQLQIHATCNVQKSFFNDWFTGHLNFQIEHHLFPTMPRHNLYKIAPLVKSLCEKHGVTYCVKPLGRAFVDIVRSLKSSGELWLATYEAHHLL
ncbi:hypothetical protein ACJMK2_014218 [Sinanodonta woodiana]|uniref:Cytochrome b5 heme-binding domain-containing protein n=1 Tax=Sinanodonta woodiana TaxID=1069815 RepID=A0ABD3V210_SINWO